MNLGDDYGLRAVRILDGKLIIESHIYQLAYIEDAIWTISNYIDGNSLLHDLRDVIDGLKNDIDEYDKCEYIQRFKRWIELIKISESFSECWDEYEEIIILADNYIDRMSKKMKIIEDTLSHTH